MNLISWNCNMAFRRKWQYLLPYQPDIMVIQECEHESKYKPKDIIPDYNQFLWMGDNINKGVGIISFNDYHIKVSASYTPKFKYVIPIEVTGATNYHLFALWAMPDKVKAKSYVGQVWGALNYYKALLDDDVVWIGDFNSNQIWDNQRKLGNHMHCVDLLSDFNIDSLYHRLTDEPHGSESTPTIYLLKQMAKPFHLDYCFASRSMISEHTQIEIGSPREWLPRSDHMPLFIEGLRSVSDSSS